MKKPVYPLAITFFMAVAGAAMAQDAASSGVRAYEPPAGEPEVVIRPGEDATYYEYRIRGELVEIRVEPDTGTVYYLVPAQGGGFLKQDGSQLAVPSWVLFEW